MKDILRLSRYLGVLRAKELTILISECMDVRKDVTCDKEEVKISCVILRERNSFNLSLPVTIYLHV